MEAKHTPGPWQAVERYEDGVTVVDSRGFEIFEAHRTAILLGFAEKLGIKHWADSEDASIDLTEEEQAANARRLVACWNACKGIPTETLEAQRSGGLPWHVADQIEQRVQVRELVEALRDYLQAQDALDNREAAGPNAEYYFELMRRRNNARDGLDAALAKHGAAA